MPPIELTAELTLEDDANWQPELYDLLRLRSELAILSVIRARHRDLQGLLDREETWFSGHATAYLLCLMILGLVNAYVILCVWLPQLTA